MKYCNNCHVSVAGNHILCPLCQNNLAESSPDSSVKGDGAEIFPFIPTIYKQFHLVFRILIFVSVVIGIIAVAVNLQLRERGWWSLFVLGGVGCFWIFLWIAVRKRRSLPRWITYQVAVISVIGVLWDLCTGWYRWSLDYVIPVVCITALAAMWILSLILRWSVESQLVYFCMCSFFGLVPIIFYFTGCLTSPIPSLVSIASSAITLAAIAVFFGRGLIEELQRRLHI